MKFLLSMLLVVSMACLSVSDMPVIDTSDIDTTGLIKRHILSTFDQCSKQCSFIDDVKSACKRRCLEEQEQRMERWLVRRYTASCNGSSSVEQFNFDPTPHQKSEELRNTVVAYQLWQENDAIRQCARVKKALHNQKISQFIQSVERSHEEKPALERAWVKLMGAIRRL